MSPPPPWHDEARRLRTQGLSVIDIAKALGRPRPTIYWVLNEHGERLKSIRRIRAFRRGYVLDRVEMIQHWERRPIRPILNKAMYPLAFQLWLDGEIPRQEMLRMITHPRAMQFPCHPASKFRHNRGAD